MAIAWKRRRKETNASVPKGTQVEAVTMSVAIELLNARAGMSKSKKPARGRKAAKAPAKKKAAKKAKKAE